MKIKDQPTKVHTSLKRKRTEQGYEGLGTAYPSANVLDVITSQMGLLKDVTDGGPSNLCLKVGSGFLMRYHPHRLGRRDDLHQRNMGEELHA